MQQRLLLFRRGLVGIFGTWRRAVVPLKAVSTGSSRPPVPTAVKEESSEVCDFDSEITGQSNRMMFRVIA
jgi:hypothetical protein